MMRFCPFCSAENTVEATHCSACARRLPPVPQRRRTPTNPGAGSAVPAKAAAESSGKQLLRALAPSPAAERRQAPPPSPAPAGVGGKRRTDFTDNELTAVDSAWGAEPAADGSEAGRERPRHLSPSPPTPTKVSAPPVPEAPAPPRRSAGNTRPPPLPARGKSPSTPPPTPGARPAVTGTSATMPAPARPKSPSQAPLFPTPGQGPLPTTGARMPPQSPHSRVAPSTATGGAPAHAAPPNADRAATANDGFGPLPTPVRHEYDAFEPPPTRILRGEGLGDRPFTPPSVLPVPEIPEPGLYPAAKYAVTFLRARWQRRGAIKSLAEDIKRDTDALDQILGSLGRVARGVGLDGRAFAAENAAISAAEARRAQLEQDAADLQSRKSDETSKYVDVEGDRTAKVTEAEAALAEAQKELTHLEGQRRSLRDKRKEIERRQRAYLKTAEDRDEEAATAPVGDQRARMRTTAESHRREAAALEPERQDVDRRLASLEKPIADSTAKVDAAKGELEAARRSLDDAREGHGHRLAELEAEHKRKAKEAAQAEAEIVRRLVTLGTLVNLNRVERPEFAELYQRVDRLRTAIGARTTEIEKLTAERDAFDKASLWRGMGTLAGVVVFFISLIVLIRACV